MHVQVTVRPSGELDDVDAERRRVEALADYSDNPIVLKDLKKIYPGLDGGKPKVGAGVAWVRLCAVWHELLCVSACVQMGTGYSWDGWAACC